MAKPIENTERISTYVTKEQLEQLKIKAKEKGMTVSGYIRLLIIEGCADTKTYMAVDSLQEDD